MNRINYPDRVKLASMPTPIVRLNHWSRELGVDLYVKHDDRTGSDLSGNKVRKLEFHFAEAQARGCDVVVTCGGVQSNHARATAIAARQLGLDAVLILRSRTTPPGGEPVDGNLFLDRLVGARVVWVTPDEYRSREAVYERLDAELRLAGRTPYLMPEGGSDEVGAWGYIAAVEEIAAQESEMGVRFDAIVHAVGSGGTTAGLVLGTKLAGVGAEVRGFAVCDDTAYFVSRVMSIVERTVDRYQLRIPFSSNELRIDDRYKGVGYALSRPEEISLIKSAARTDGIILDPVYTGKAFFGMVDLIRADRLSFGRRVLFVHTGGIFGLLAATSDVVPSLA
ncbi:MAG: D-cysteine desulfhydrase family protein [Deltaproteobacteria bacterium]|nr:D-cysteine desulfhydrase family protein [Deltaproteobacteria bacterium]